MKKNFRIAIKHSAILIFITMSLNPIVNAQSSVKEFKGSAPVVPLLNEPPPKLFVDPPLVEPLSFGRVIIQYRAENIHFVPVYGSAALAVSPRVGHVHITVDNASWHWADASGEPLILNGFVSGKHTVLIELADPTHKIIDRKEISFIIPDLKKIGE